MNIPDSTVDKEHMASVAIELFFAITAQWKLSDSQCCVLAGVSTRSTLYKWRKSIETGKAINLSRDTLERMSYIAGIYKALQLLFCEPNQWAEYVHKPNRDFGGASAMDRMLNGRVVDLADVRRYLDGWRGEVYA